MHTFTRENQMLVDRKCLSHPSIDLMCTDASAYAWRAQTFWLRRDPLLVFLLPCISFFQIQGPWEQKSLTQFLMFIASCPVVATTYHVCSHLRAFAFTVLFLKPYSDRYFQCPLLTLFTHLPIMEVFLDTHYVNTCPITLLYCSSESLSLPKMMLFN